METKSIFQLKELTINNFRCFSTYSIAKFGEESTVFIGRNGVGKTTLLTAIVNALSFIFSKNEILKQRSLSSGNPDLTIKNISPLEVYTLNGITADSVKISAKAEFSNKPLEWELYKKATNSALSPTLYKKAYETFIKEIDNEKAILPLIVFFSDSFPHIESNIGPFAKRSLEKSSNLLKNFGYYQWSSKYSCTKFWELLFKNKWENALSDQQSILLNKQKINRIETATQQTIDIEYAISSLKSIEEYKDKIDSIQYEELVNTLTVIKQKEDSLSLLHKEISFISDRVISLCNAVSIDEPDYTITNISIQTHGDEKEVFFDFISGKQLTINQLPAGYQRIISIAFDIITRALILNGYQVEPSGIVLIDEIDLHLHPGLEKTVLPSFKKAFPKIQFIVTTHSAAVISNFQKDENNIIISMHHSKEDFWNEILPNVYGLDYNTTIRDAMEINNTPADITNLEADYFNYIERNMVDKADETFKQIQKLTGKDSQVVKNIRAKIQLFR